MQCLLAARRQLCCNPLLQVHNLTGPFRVEDKQGKPALPGDLLVVEICDLGPLTGYEWVSNANATSLWMPGCPTTPLLGPKTLRKRLVKAVGTQGCGFSNS